MFDKLVESTKQKPQGRSRFYLVTSLIYGFALSIVGVLTILWFTPAMAEANTAIEIVFAPPPPPPPPPPLSPTQIAPIVEERWIPPVKPPETIADPAKVLPKPISNKSNGSVVGAINTGGVSGGAINGIPGGLNTGAETEPPPPPPPPAPKATPTPEPTPKTPDVVRLPSTMITGKAVRKVQPPYPPIAKSIKVQGTVPVQIMISEEGHVISAQAVGGHPTLQQAAQQAAMQWVFSPTILNGKGVKVSGVISFNFILN